MTEALLTTSFNGVIRYTAIWYLLESLMNPAGIKSAKWFRLARWLSISVIECLLTVAGSLVETSSGWTLFFQILFVILPQAVVIMCFADRAYQAPVIQKINVFIVFNILVGGLADLFSKYYVNQYLSEEITASWSNAAHQSLKTGLILLILFVWYTGQKITREKSLLNAHLFLLHFSCLLLLGLMNFTLNSFVYLLISLLAIILFGRIKKMVLIRQIEEQKEQLRIQKQRIRRMKENSQQQSWLRHDLRNLLTSVQVLVDQGQRKEALNLLDRIEQQWQNLHMKITDETADTESSDSE